MKICISWEGEGRVTGFRSTRGPIGPFLTMQCSNWLHHLKMMNMHSFCENVVQYYMPNWNKTIWTWHIFLLLSLSLGPAAQLRWPQEGVRWQEALRTPLQQLLPVIPARRRASRCSQVRRGRRRRQDPGQQDPGQVRAQDGRGRQGGRHGRPDKDCRAGHWGIQALKG